MRLHAPQTASVSACEARSRSWHVLGKTLDVEFEQPFLEALERAVTPSDADVMVARGVVLDMLSSSDEPVLLTAFEDAWLAAHGSRRPAERTTLQAVTSPDPNRRYADPDPRDPHLMEFRARHSLRRAVAQLIGEGLIAQGEGNQYPIQPTRISVTYPGGGTSAPVVVHSPAIGDESSTPRFLPIRSIGPRQGDVLLPAEEMLAGLDAILGRRGINLVRESRRALHNGLYLASSSLLAAASEAAWFNLARSVPGRGAKLTSLVDGGRDVSEVIRLTSQHLSALPRSQALVTEVVAQAHLFRDIRNYALHPVEDDDEDRQTWLTESGATLLAIAARRYFVRLSELQARLAEVNGTDGEPDGDQAER